MKSPISLKVSTRVPEKSSGRTLDALVDIIRPFTERRGLKADQIRLQREDVAIKIAELSHKRLEIEKAEIKPIPLKGLVPFLEKSSLEDPDDTVMISMWANLLASAAAVDSVNLSRHVTVLSEISSRQAHLLDRMIDRDRESDTDQLSYDNLLYSRLAVGSFDHYFRTTRCKTYFTAMKGLIKQFDYPGLAIDHISVTGPRGSDSWPTFTDETNETILGERYEIDIPILEGLGVIKQERLNGINFKEGEFTLSYFRVTPFGADLYARCNPNKFSDFPPTKRQSRDTGASSP